MSSPGIADLGPHGEVTGDRAGDLGVYIHYPWCRRLCPYCDFPVAVARDGAIPHHEYLAAVLRELAERRGDFAGRRLRSIYFGGGTPSLWPDDCLATAIREVVEAFDARIADLEITIEANPTDCTAPIMTSWRSAGIDRLSIGVQSVAARTLVALGRDHRMGDGVAAVRRARDAGFPRITADVIFGVPDGEPGDTGQSLTAIAEADVGHISVYELTIEDRTAFGRAARAGTLIPLDDEILAEAYSAVHWALIARGYEHYEVSSYARPGQRSVHNQLYWRGAEYLGLGNGAASFRRLPGDAGAERVTNQRSVKRYLKARGEQRVATREALDPEAVADDLLWLGMRTADGIPWTALDHRPEARQWLLENLLAEQRHDRIQPTLKGFLYCDRIAARLLGA